MTDLAFLITCATFFLFLMPLTLGLCNVLHMGVQKKCLFHQHLFGCLEIGAIIQNNLHSIFLSFTLQSPQLYPQLQICILHSISHQWTFQRRSHRESRPKSLLYVSLCFAAVFPSVTQWLLPSPPIYVYVATVVFTSSALLTQVLNI